MARIGYPVIITLIAFGIVFRYAVLDFAFIPVMPGDATQEFAVYSLIVETGKWQVVPSYTLVSASLFTTYFPAMFQRAFGTDLFMTFKLFPCFIAPFLPMVVYYLARKWLSPFYAFLVSWFAIGQVTFLIALAFGRTVIALVFFGLILLVVFNEGMRFRTKLGLFVLLSSCLVTAHYGTTFGSIIVIGVTIGAMVILKRIRRYSYPNLGALSAFWVILLVGAIVWLGIINTHPLKGGISFVRHSLDVNPSGVIVPARVIVPEGERPLGVEGVIVPEGGYPQKEYGFFSLEVRSKVIQAAFGKTLHKMNIPQKIEFSLSWLTILMMTWGLALMAKRWGLREDFVLLMLVCYSTIVVSVVLPSVGIRYGIARVFLHMVVVLAPCFVLGGLDMGRRLKVPASLLLLVVLMTFGMCTSGIMHSFFGLAR